MDSDNVTRIRKLLKLAESPNPHEAARAAEQAQALMVRYGFTADDVAEHVIHEADDHRDAYREFLAHLAASLCQCSVMFRKSGGIGFKGMPAKVKKAQLFYQSAMDEVLGASLPQQYAPWIEDAAREVWRFFWWDGFAAAVYERFGRRPPVEPTELKSVIKPESAIEPANAETVLEQVRDSVKTLSHHTDVDWLKRAAINAGRGAGFRIQLRENEARVEPMKGLTA